MRPAGWRRNGFTHVDATPAWRFAIACRPGAISTSICAGSARTSCWPGWRISSLRPMSCGSCAVAMPPDRKAERRSLPRFGVGPEGGVEACGDRKSVVEGKSVSVRVDLGGGRIIKKKTHSNEHYIHKHHT